jgi:hypothetical protein
VNVVAGEIALAALAVVSVLFGLLRTGLLKPRVRAAPPSTLTLDRVRRIRAARDARFGRRRR